MRLQRRPSATYCEVRTTRACVRTLAIKSSQSTQGSSYESETAGLVGQPMVSISNMAAIPVTKRQHNKFEHKEASFGSCCSANENFVEPGPSFALHRTANRCEKTMTLRLYSPGTVQSYCRTNRVPPNSDRNLWHSIPARYDSNASSKVQTSKFLIPISTVRACFVIGQF